MFPVTKQKVRPGVDAQRAAVVGPRLTASAGDDTGKVRRGGGAAVEEQSQFLVLGSGVKWTSVVLVRGSQPSVRWNIDHSPPLGVLVARTMATEMNARCISDAIRAAAIGVVATSRLGPATGSSCCVVGRFDLACAIVTLAGNGKRRASAEQICRATDSFADAWVEALSRGSSAGWYSALMVGAAVMEAVVGCVGAGEIAMLRETSTDLT